MLNLFVLLVPPILSLLALFIGGPLIGISPTIENILLSTILGFVLSTWIGYFRVEHGSKYIKEQIQKSRDFEIQIITSQDEVEAQLRSFYRSTETVIYSTSINYIPMDIKLSDSRRSDWAYTLYSKNGITTQFNRIVSVIDKKDKDWVRKMIHEKKKFNSNYDLRIIESVPSPALFPNFIIMKRGNSYRLFMSYRAHAAEGRFSFLTLSTAFCEGIWQYASKFHSSLPTAEECIKRW
jgi:hypothetical protein